MHSLQRCCLKLVACFGFKAIVHVISFLIGFQYIYHNFEHNYKFSIFATQVSPLYAPKPSGGGGGGGGGGGMVSSDRHLIFTLSWVIVLFKMCSLHGILEWP